VSAISRLILLAYFVEVGLVLLVVPWSPFWDRNYFVQMWPALEILTRSNLVRGAVSGQPLGGHVGTRRPVRDAHAMTGAAATRRTIPV
jgi:hypothetical protein